ncbi:DUF2441 domain-containing protein [Tamlana sp. s12]|uniref:DUF2441 domain-containing protein n=1 Tax=Tamlana sp. s12 TaxID=1630406 RepID=UPI0007FFA67D|nr:DUF2441 domain-containing protein [Tamlana sp. s12]OBQ52803.1 hypothetical protein VQ01_12680 [Tamlana sp. s12]QQY81176.1 DUF2441 domain-containing protein [Tamlana sp. s12]
MTKETLKFIYFIDLNEPIVCLNLINTNQISSPTLAHYHSYRTEYPLYKITPDELLTDINSTQFGFVSPRFQYIIISNWATNGLKVGIGTINTKFYSNSDIERIHKIAKLEVEFEKVRRQINSNLPSRLTCIFVAEDDIDGRNMLRNMFFNRTKFHIAPVVLNSIKSHKADSKWITDYEKTKKISSIVKYWQGIDFDKHHQYEYLIEGVVRLENKEDREIIKTEFNSEKYYS